MYVVVAMFLVVKDDAYSCNPGLYQRCRDRVFLCRFNIQEGVPEVFAEVRSMLARPCS